MPESPCASRTSVPSCCLLGREGWAAYKALVPCLLLKWGKLLPSGLQNGFLNVRYNSYSGDVCGIRLRLRFLKFHLFHLSASLPFCFLRFLPRLSSEHCLNKSLSLRSFAKGHSWRNPTCDRHQAPQIQPGIMCAGSSGTFLAAQGGRPQDTQITYTHALEILRAQFQTTTIKRASK